MLSPGTIADAVGTAAKALGVTTALGSAYLALGLPLPASTQYVDGKIATVVVGIADVKVTILEGQSRNIVSQRALLRNEKSALTRTIERAPTDVKTVLNRRMGEIDDALMRLTREEDAVNAKLNASREVVK